MEKTNRKIILIAVALALVTAILIYSYISSMDTTTTVDTPKTDLVSVYAAAKTIPGRTQVTEADIKQIQVDRKLLAASAIMDKKDIVGRYTLESIISGEQILNERLADERSMLFSYKVPKGTRAVSINVNEQIGVANMVRPGDFVDVVASFEKEEEDNGQTIKNYPRITKTLIQNVEVLALGQDSVLTAEKLKDQPVTVTLAIRQEDVEQFVFASEFATLRLALRPLEDNSINNTQGVIRSDISGSKGVYAKPSGNPSGN